MTPALATVNIFNVFSVTDIVGQIITLSLCLASLVAWTVMFGKHFELKRIREMNHAFEQRLRDERTLLDQSGANSWKNRRHIPYGDVYADAIDAYWRADGILRERGETAVRARLEHAENAIQRSIARQVLRYETSMIFLATVVTGAPFMGLLGTVWGVMEAFTAVAGQQTASIQTLAPGVSAALLTTVAGLLVAIPSLLGYNFLLGKTRQLTTEIENFASSLADRIELETQ
ncbi:MAG: MotA/TolQ/ExbB proton channel family protein [Opitutaceae bacterium]|jgi:biopolymer transport protein TolQ|nr:MotA/TolQ/ExbB proton channel family protein [Opitutaceae bacterium]